MYYSAHKVICILLSQNEASVLSVCLKIDIAENARTLSLLNSCLTIVALLFFGEIGNSKM